MLVLSRKEGQRIVVGGKVVITIVESRSGCVRIGIEAPPEVSVHREEVFERVKSERLVPTLTGSLHGSAFHPEFA